MRSAKIEWEDVCKSEKWQVSVYFSFLLWNIPVENVTMCEAVILTVIGQPCQYIWLFYHRKAPRKPILGQSTRCNSRSRNVQGEGKKWWPLNNASRIISEYKPLIAEQSLVFTSRNITFHYCTRYCRAKRKTIDRSYHPQCFGECHHFFPRPRVWSKIFEPFHPSGGF